MTKTARAGPWCRRDRASVRPLLVANYAYVLGGGEVGLRMLVEGLTARGLRPVLAVPGTGRLFDEFEQQSIAEEPPQAAADLRALAAGCHVIHTFSARWALAAARGMTGKPLILHALLPTRSRDDRAAASAVDLVVCNSRATAARFDPPVRPRVVYNGVRRPEPARPPLHVRPGRRTIGLVGNICPRKGQYDVLPALERVLELRPDIDVVFAGRVSGAIGLVLSERAATSAGRIRMLGFVPDIADHLATLSLVLVPSRSEGFGRVAVEAMRAGTPILATRVEGLIEGLSGLRDPWLPDDRARWAERIVQELDAPSHSRAELEAAGARFDPSAYIEAIVGCYEDVLGGRANTD